ncbi:MAG: HEAT repeat domain-containing protein [Nitrospirae bacterium]|nr:HEAT repeat domain-containing protein [Nitrospirota bacterium]
MLYFCTRCWNELGVTDSTCPYCGATQDESTARDYYMKLVGALRHPVPETVRRVIWILGERREIEAVDALHALYEESPDPFVQAEIVRALGRIGTEQALELVKAAATHASLLVRKAALAASFETTGRLYGR